MATADKQAALKEVTEMLEIGVKSVFTSGRYLEYLNFLSKFHNYSYNNCILIMMQNPEASYVAGFNDWKNKHHRYVRKGEKGIKIIAPAPYKTTVDVPVLDSNNQPVIIDGKPLTEKKVVQKLSFRVVSVFDVSQTDGEPLPSLAPELTAQVENYEELFAAICETSDFYVKFADIPGGAKGMCSYRDRTITIRPGMSQAQTIKTALHEEAHARLHDITKNGVDPDTTRATKEVQAESIAFVVANHFGIDTSDYSFDYVANWSTDKEISELKESLEVIQREASAMIDIIEAKYAEIIKSKETVIQESIEPVTNPENAIPVPDTNVSVADMNNYGYTYESMLPVDPTTANLFWEYLPEIPMYKLYPDNTESLFNPDEEIIQDDLLYGIEKPDWERAYSQYFESPRVKILWSEHLHPQLKDNTILSIKEADAVFESCDLAAKASYPNGGYDKTKFAVFFTANNKIQFYTDRQDFGDGDGSLTQHISLSHSDIASVLQCHGIIDVLESYPRDSSNVRAIRRKLNSINPSDKDALLAITKALDIEMNDVKKTQEIVMLDTILTTLKIDDVQLSYNADGILIATDGYSTWQGAEFYQFLANETFVFTGENSILGVSDELFAYFKSFAKDYNVEVRSRQASFVNPNKEPITSQSLAEFISSHKEFIANNPNEHNTIVINAFAGPGAGKTTSCLEICAELKKAGYVAEYVQEYAKELVWEGNLDMLSGSTEGQFHILKEQLSRMDRLYGKVDFIVTDCPVLLPAIYLKEPNPEFEVASKEIFEHFRNFNYFVERDVSSFETKGRIHNLEESLKIDETLKSTLSSYGLYYGFYNHSTINKIVTNSIRYRENTFTTVSDKEQPSFSDIDIASKVREIPIVDYAARMGFTVQRVGSYYTLKEHDSVRIDPRTNRYFRNSTGERGSIIDFVMEFENVNNTTAISRLARYLGSDRPAPTRATSYKPREKKTKIQLPQKGKNMRNVFAYLIQTRKISPEIVNEWVSKKNLYQDSHNNCVFVTYDAKGNPAFASQRGTNTTTPFKADIPGSNYDVCHFINNGASKLIVCEGVIDLMSVQTILKAHGRDLSKYNYLSLNGSTKVQAVVNALQSSKTDTVILATDNDHAGELARIALRELISEYSSDITIQDYVPKNEKDWNAELVARVLSETQQEKGSEPFLSDMITDGITRSDSQNADTRNTPSVARSTNKTEQNL